MPTSCHVDVDDRHLFDGEDDEGKASYVTTKAPLSSNSSTTITVNSGSVDRRRRIYTDGKDDEDVDMALLARYVTTT